MSREAHRVEQVLVFVEVEHIAHVDVAFLDFSIERERGAEGNVGSRDVELELVNQVDECRGTEEGIAGGDGASDASYFA